MPIESLQCPGYFEDSDGRTQQVGVNGLDVWNPVVIWEIANTLRVKCAKNIEGFCTEGSNGERIDGETEVRCQHKPFKGKQIKCVFEE